MKDAAREAFIPLTVNFEGGYIDWLFPDVKKLISTGFGLLMDPVALASGLPWRLPDGSLASRDEIIAQWARLKNFVEQNPGSEFRSYKTFADKTTIRLGREGLYQAFRGKIEHNLVVLREGFAEWDSWPADAQLGVMSMAWACGPAFYRPSAGRNYWPKLTDALRRRDFFTASVECFMNEERKNPGIIPRNRANKILFVNAAIADGKLDPDVLYYPLDLDKGPIGDDDPTLEEPKVVPFPIVHPKVPLGRDALDDVDLPDLSEHVEDDDEPPPQAA